MYWKLKVSGYGKIEHAEIEVAPLTLFVGDNNSGKSYLMSLLWGIQNLGTTEMMKGEDEEDADEIELVNWFKKQIAVVCKQDICIANASEISDALQFTLDKGLKGNKENLVKKIFNSASVRIKELRIELENMDKVSLTFERIRSGVGYEKDMVKIYSNTGMEFFYNFLDISPTRIDEYLGKYIVKSILLSLVTGISTGTERMGSDIYFPAARTGFMLTKNIINKVGRDTTFNIDMEQKEVTPFVRPINQFLDVMSDLALDGEGNKKFSGIATYLESGMAEGIVDMSTLPNREVMYIPVGLGTGIPLRVVSAVVTELSPLILILKHKWNLETLFYEEPETCLHPKLQQKMARVICQLVNAGLKMVITTHSDIILQHINNMIRLSGREDAEDICQQFGYQESDLMKAENVKVYQLKSGAGIRTKVEEIVCGENGFAIPTFNEALDRIIDEAYAIQE